MSPKTSLAAIVIIVLAGAGLYFIFASPTSETGTGDKNAPPREQPDTDPIMRDYSNQMLGLSFRYPDSYELTERDAEGSAMRGHHVIALMRKADLPVPEGGEGPPAITIDIYQNDLDKQTAESWIRNASESNFKLGEGRLSSTTISGKEALSFRWSGLYEGTTMVRAEPEWIYAFSVTYLQPGDTIVQDFVSVRDSARIDVRAPAR